MKFKVLEIRTVDTYKLSGICPHCHTASLFNPVGSDMTIGDGIICGQRVCPLDECKGHIFFIVRNNVLQIMYPFSPIEFNSENIPDNVRKTFEEALNCHASGFFTASAIMLRRTLEEICEDRKVKGKDLKEKILNLSKMIILPQELIDGMDNLRLLGNDAAHVEAMTYTQISNEEILIGIDFTKEILKALYQYVILLEKINKLKKPLTL